ncbi:assimilatory nitrate reductase (NADH) alpha subunit apoprotein [Paracoccus pantotrophus]|uniref:Assimilatory nitrate reductase (NADH) alpha subunit apoprotein n=1 Tax=Paracoccus pantotrophus TaxID=82367 RepID=A0AAE6TV81_PARPN|nr:nitrate reductase [Paracoccus pantotrophus]QFG35055.1 molybdopterin-dependent oxidoreductase [Paracoccus pantotrophus]RKS44767.1 assimilatory nitrate reductase (NADH) alpha subunit apoprotein [Paracoccus pantotrophus]
MQSIRTTCPYCGVGCGVLAAPDGRGGLGIAGDPDHPANKGRLCVKGSALGETIGHAGRLLAPRIHGREAGWDEALDLVARRFSETIAEHGPDSVGFYVSGQLLTEDYYVANKLMKGFIGSGNIDTNSRLCMASAVAGHRRAFGTDTVPGLYEDIELADTVVLVGSNLAWCHPVLYQRLAAAREARGTRVVVVDPRRTATCDIADLHLPLAPGSDSALFNLLLAEIGRKSEICADNLEGIEDAMAAARETLPSTTGLAHSQIRQFLDLWLHSDKVVTVWSQGVNQSDSGTDKVNAILNCHLASGRIGRPGMGPFSVTGQPNAMGGREVGGLANMLACHLEIENPAHREAVRAFWNAPRMAERPGLKAVDMFRAVEDGRIKALWIICTNPAATMPEADRVARAIAGCDFVVVSDIMARTDTVRLAHVALPATGWGEKDGTVTNSERRISRQRRTLAPAGRARDDWRILAEVGRRMGWPGAFGWTSPAEVFAEHAALSGIAGGLGSDFDISAHAGITQAEYDALEPFLWPQSAGRQGGRFFGDGRFHTPSGRGRMVAVTPRPPQPVGGDHPFRLNTGRVRDHWHSMTRTGLSPRLSRHLAEPFLELHPSDAARLGLAPASLAEVESPQGRAVLRVLVSDRVAPGHPFAPMHWTRETAPSGRVDALVPGTVDPVSGQPALKSAPVAIRPFAARWFGFAVSAGAIRPDCDYWARATLPRGEQAELAGLEMPQDWTAHARALFGLSDEPLVLHDRARGQVRLAFLREGRLRAALFVAPGPVGLSRSHVAALLGEGGAEVLAGRPGADRPDEGALVCACFGIGVNSIVRAIASQALTSVEAVGQALRAGTNCGSCRPEIRALLEAGTACRAAAE